MPGKRAACLPLHLVQLELDFPGFSNFNAYGIMWTPTVVPLSQALTLQGLKPAAGSPGCCTYMVCACVGVCVCVCVCM